RRDREAMPELLAYLKDRPFAPESAFLWYLVADYSLRHADHGRAARAYAMAASAVSREIEREGTTDPAATPPDAQPPWTALAPLTCPALADAPESARRFWQAEESNPVADPKQFAALWNRSLRGEEIALAAFAARLYREGRTPDSAGTTTSTIIEESAGTVAVDTSDAGLSRIQSRALERPGVREALGKALTNLLREPEQHAHHQVCLQQLETLEREQLAAIQRGALTPARERLELARTYLTRMHFARVAFLRDRNSLYRYGAYTLRQGHALQGRPRKARAIQALHAMRRAFAASEFASPTTFQAANSSTPSPPRETTGVVLRLDDPAAARAQAQILHRIAEAYAMMGRGGDRDTLTRIAYLLADHADRRSAGSNSSGDAATEAEAANQRKPSASDAVRREIFKRCGENYHNREALLVLLGGLREATNERAKAPRPPFSAAFYREKLHERDQKFEEAELLSAFTP
ncbi:MAG: hypothetical protein RIF32_03855, partial [Leptospirales bacterium]